MAEKDPERLLAYLNESDRLICGIQILLKLFCNALAVIVIEDDKMDAVKLLAEKQRVIIILILRL